MVWRQGFWTSFKPAVRRWCEARCHLKRVVKPLGLIRGLSAVRCCKVSEMYGVEVQQEVLCKRCELALTHS